MKLILLTILLFGFGAHAWYPNRDAQEFRMVMSSEEGLFGSLWNIEGQLISKKFLNDDTSLGGSFKLGEEESALAANLTYGINKYFFVTVSGNMNNKKSLGGSVWISGLLNEDDMSYLPFVLIDHNQLSSVGMVLYYDISGVSVHVGLAYRPPILTAKHHNVTIMFGTSFTESKKYDKIKEIEK